MRKSGAGAVLLAFSTLGCQTISVNDVMTDRRPTAIHKAEMVGVIKENFYDPYSIRDAQITNQLEYQNGRVGYCVRANGKNAMGGYAGRAYYRVFFSGATIVGYVPQDPWCRSNRKRFHWNEFNEAEAIS